MFTRFLLASALASAAFATECTRTYVVKEGDWCDTISQAHNVSTYQLSTVNSDKLNDACTNLEVGQELCLGIKDQDCTITHNVVYGDTCDKIMQGAAINATMLYANNPQIDEYCSNIYIGEVLCVAGAYAAPEPIPERQVGSPSGEPAGPPATTPYPEAKPKSQPSVANPAPAPTNNNAAPVNNDPPASPAPAPAPAPAPETNQSNNPSNDPSSNNNGDDDDLDECEDDEY